jgi:hypothetical protein
VALSGNFNNANAGSASFSSVTATIDTSGSPRCTRCEV